MPRRSASEVTLATTLPSEHVDPTYGVEVGPRHPAVRVSGDVGQRQVEESEVAVLGLDVGDDALGQSAVGLQDRGLVDRPRPGPGHSRNLVLAAKRALDPPASCTAVKTDSTSCPAAAWTVLGRSRLSFQSTPWPPMAASIRRPVTIPVWLGKVTVISCSVRALRVAAPLSMKWKRFGIPFTAEPADRGHAHPVDRDGQDRLGLRGAHDSGGFAPCGHRGRRWRAGQYDGSGGEQGDERATKVHRATITRLRRSRRIRPGQRDRPVPRGSPPRAWSSGGRSAVTGRPTR